jgi:hypothetical protein
MLIKVHGSAPAHAHRLGYLTHIIRGQAVLASWTNPKVLFMISPQHVVYI